MVLHADNLSGSKIKTAKSLVLLTGFDTKTEDSDL